ncbi:MAG TPA: MurT ligase domain-containing protein [Solirubrobacterales bacterium]
MLRNAWDLPQLGDRVGAISEIAQAIGPARRDRSTPARDLPYTLTNLAVAAHRVSRARGGGATALPGIVVLRRAPRAIRALRQERLERCVLVSGTNGKTTTASMIAAILREAGYPVAHNRAGANTPYGVATALLEADGGVGVLEVDEAWLPIVAAEACPDVVVLCNLFRDRLDAYGELDGLAIAWEAMICGGLEGTLVLNADDPTIAALGALGARHGAPAASFFGIEDRDLDLPGAEHAADSIRCRSCDGPLRFEARMLSHMGHHRCDSCGSERPRPRVTADEIRIDGISGSRFSVDVGAERLQAQLRLPGLYNVYNALAAAAAARALDIDSPPIGRALAAFVPVFGRGERFRIGSTEVVVLLMKNPAGANELMRTLDRDEAASLDLLIVLNDARPDGRDISWIWDADFEALAPRVGSVVCSGSRAAELALRLKYAGWPVSRMLVEHEIATAFDRAVEAAGDRLIALPTYTALLDLHIELSDRGLVEPYWAARQPA